MMISASAWSRVLTAVLAAMLFLLSVLANAQTSGVRADADPAAIAAVEKLEIGLCGVLVRSEWQRYAANLTEDYVRVLPGKIQSKAEVLLSPARPLLKFAAQKPIVGGELGIVHGQLENAYFWNTIYSPVESPRRLDNSGVNYGVLPAISCFGHFRCAYRIHLCQARD